MLESPDMNSQPGTECRIYLASNSPRRKELLSLIGLEYNLLPAQVDETSLPGEDAIDYVKRIAKSKADAASVRLQVAGIVIAADTAVVDHSPAGSPQIFGKPAGENEAARMLRSLRGHTHQVFTALFILPDSGGKALTDVCTTDVPMREYSDPEIMAYIASGDPLDKAGAYAIQHAGFHPVDKLEGCYANVMGLPLCHLARNLFQLGIMPTKNVPQVCQAALGYDCPVHSTIFQERIPAGALS